MSQKAASIKPLPSGLWTCSPSAPGQPQIQDCELSSLLLMRRGQGRGILLCS